MVRTEQNTINKSGKCRLIKEHCADFRPIKRCCYVCRYQNECPEKCLNHPTKCNEFYLAEGVKRTFSTEEEYKEIVKDYQKGMDIKDIAEKHNKTMIHIRYILQHGIN